MSPHIVAYLLAIGWSVAMADFLGAWSPPPELTTVREVRALTPQAANAGRLVKLSGVVTHVNRIAHDFYLQDATGGLYVRPGSQRVKLAPGDRIELKGVTCDGGFAPCVTPLQVRVLESSTALPEPHPFTLLAVDSRWLDAQWVEARVVVQGVCTGPGVTRLAVYTHHGRGVLIVPGEEHAPTALALKGATVTVRGVCVPTVRNRMVAGRPHILMNTLPTAASQEVEDSPPHPIDGLLQHAHLHFCPSHHLASRQVKVIGVVTALPFPGVVVVQDHTRGAIIWTDRPHYELSIGSRVEATGMLRIDRGQVGLSRATIQVLGEGPVPTPIPARPGDLTIADRGLLVMHVEGHIEQVRELEGWTAMTIFDGAERFEAYTATAPDQNGLARLERGSRVTVVGVPVDARPDGKPAGRPGLFFHTPEAVSLIESPPPAPEPPSPWWTTRRAGYLIGGFLTLVVLGCTWVMLLRSQVRGATEEIQRQYEEKVQLERQLRQAAKLEAIGQLAGGIAHDFNNLLTVINGCAEILIEEAAGYDGRLSGLADDIRRAGERAASLTRQLLTFSRKRNITLAAVNLNEVVADAVRLLGRVIGETIRVKTTLAAELPAVQAEAGLLHQVMMNLAVNARDAMPTGGTLKLETARIDGTNQFVRLSVSDTGTGMTEEVKARLFEPFFTTKPVGEGTGLGLATVYSIVQTLGGRIQVDTATGQGTTFHIDLPVYTAPPSNLIQTPLPSKSLAGYQVMPRAKLTGVTALVVEDDDMVRDLLVTGLTAEGATALAASRPEHALQVLATHPGRIDVMVTDVVMPGMNGRALAERAKAERPGIKVMFMSGYTPDEVIRQGIHEDEVVFLQKPFTPDQLTTRLKQVLAGKASGLAGGHD